MERVNEAKGMKVVVAIDFSTAAESALERALSIANASPGGEVHAVSVVDTDSVLPDYMPSEPLARLQQLAEEALARFEATEPVVHVARVVVHLLHGSPAEAIVWLAAHLEADLVIVGTHGRRALPRMLLGSVAERVLRTAGCPVLVERVKKHDAALRAPEIEPLCPACNDKREATAGRDLWCEKHARPHLAAHVYSEAKDRAAAAFRPWGFTG